MLDHKGRGPVQSWVRGLGKSVGIRCEWRAALREAPSGGGWGVGGSLRLSPSGCFFPVSSEAGSPVQSKGGEKAVTMLGYRRQGCSLGRGAAVRVTRSFWGLLEILGFSWLTDSPPGPPLHLPMGVSLCGVCVQVSPFTRSPVVLQAHSNALLLV